MDVIDKIHKKKGKVMKKKQVVSLLLAATLMGSSVFSGIATLDVSAKTNEHVYRQ